jgi:hypothetical protein
MFDLKTEDVELIKNKADILVESFISNEKKKRK